MLFRHFTMNKDKNIFLATQTRANVENPTEKDISKIGTIGKVLQLLRLPDGTVKALVEGKSRARIIQFILDEKFFQVGLEPIGEDELSEMESIALIRAVVDNFNEYAKINKNVSINIY